MRIQTISSGEMDPAKEFGGIDAEYWYWKPPKALIRERGKRARAPG